MEVTVVGSGIIGLTTATVFQQLGYSVRILTRDDCFNSTSAKAGAIWFPYSAAPADKVNHWSAISYDWYKALAEEAETGVQMVDLLVLATPESDNNWINELPKEAVRKALPSELPAGFTEGFMARVPMIPPPVYLEYLQYNFLRNGGSIKYQTIQSADELAVISSPVINCTGLGAREICNDTSIFPIRGQILKAAPLPGNCMVNSTLPGALSYVIHRKDAIILGGTDEAYNESLEVNPEDSRQILSRLEQLGYLPERPEIIDTLVGLRPKRTVIRCEQDAQFPNVFHNYGHGGAGFTTAWGCAEEIALLVAQNE